MDVTNEETVKKATKIVRAQDGKLDVLVIKYAFELEVFVSILTISLQCGHKWTNC